MMTDDETLAAKVVAAYRDGLKISAIEREFNVPPATIYWMLDQAGAAPDRMRRADRLAGNRVQMAHLYEIIKEQADWIDAAIPHLATASPELVKAAPRYAAMLARIKESG